MVNIIFTIIGIVLYGTFMPFIGKTIYPFRSKKLISIYFISIGILFALNMIFMETIDPSYASQIFSDYGAQLATPMFYVLFLFYAAGGMSLKNHP